MRFTLLLTLILAVCYSGLSAEPAGKRARSKGGAKELRGRLTGVKTQIKQKRRQIRATRQKERRITQEIVGVEQRLLTTEDRLMRTRARIRQIARRRKALLARIDVTEKRIEGRRKTLARRVRENYERGNPSYLQVLLRARSVHEYVARSYYVERIVESDAALVAGMKADRKQLETDRRELEAQAAEQQQLRSTLEQTRIDFEDARDEKRDLLHEVKHSREAMEQALDELEAASRDIEQQIRALQATPRGRARMMRAWTGTFIKPAAGPITSGFGWRYHPILHRQKLHTGVDIGAGYGASIHAAGDGEVIMSTYYRGYGNCVIIDHGGGVTTLYGHASALLVTTGQTVHKGDVIARVGSTGLSTGPHLHFEVRRNGTPVSPF